MTAPEMEQTDPLWIDSEQAPTVPDDRRPMDHKAQPKKKDRGPIPKRQGNGYYADHLTGDRLRSVTTILSGGVPKPGLVFWAGNTCTDSAIDNLPALVAASRHPEKLAGMRDWIRRAHTRKKDERADVGTAVHKIVEATLLGTPMPEAILVGEGDDAQLVRLDSDQLAPFVVHFNRFLVAWEPEFTASEMVVARPQHGYAGTLDFTISGRGRIGDALRGQGYDVDADVMGDTKGLALDTVLPTPTGWTTMAAVQVGDLLIGRDGKPCTVTETSEIHVRDCYRVTFDDGSSVVCDDEHLWLTDTGIQAPQIKRQVSSTVDLRATLVRHGRRQHRVPVADPLDLPGADLPIDPYLLGCRLGDGHTRDGCITKADDLFDVLLSDGHHLGVRQAQPVGKEHIATRTVRGLTHALGQADLRHDKHIPGPYLRASYAQRLALLRGLMDTDGAWNRGRHSAQFVSVDKAFATAVRELIVSLGHRCTMSEQPHTGFKPGVHYVVTFTPRRGLNPFRLPRKADLVNVARPARSGRRLVKSIEPTLTVPTKCIAVDSSDCTYLCTEDMIPTHNTGGDWGRVTAAGHVHGVYPEAGLQMSAYRCATVCWLRDGQRVPMPATAEVGVVLHLRPEGYAVYPVACGERAYAYFRHAQMVDEWSSRIGSARADVPVIGKALVVSKATGAMA